MDHYLPWIIAGPDCETITRNLLNGEVLVSYLDCVNGFLGAYIFRYIKLYILNKAMLLYLDKAIFKKKTAKINSKKNDIIKKRKNHWKKIIKSHISGKGLLCKI